MQPLPLPDGSYADEARPWTAQDVINWIPTQAESTGTRTPIKYMTPPGLRPFVEAGTGPVRGTYNAEGRLLAVIGKMLYRISNTGVAIPIGTVPGVSRVAFAHNQITSGNEVLVVNGSAGYVYNTVEDSFERITDEGYPGGISATFIDGYLLQIEPARRYAFHSDLADAMSYNTLDRFTSEYRPDLLVALASSNNELILFSETSYEVFENTGASQQPFRSRQITGDKGCASRYGVAVMDQRVLWLADDGMFYAMEGYAPKRISTRPIEQSILGLNWGQAFAEVWEEAGHSVCYWTFPDGMTWGWDASTGKWHRRQSYEMKRWRANTLTKWGQRWIAGDFQGPRLWTVDRDYMLEGDIEYISEVTTGVIHNNQNRVVMPRLEVIMDAGRDETIAVDYPVQPEGPTIEGDAPGGTVGFDYPDFQYTLTEGDNPIEEVYVSAGTLPDGLTLSDSGLLTGIPTKGGTFTWTARVRDSVGLWDEVEDSAIIGVGVWWMTGAESSNPRNSLWISHDVTDWTDAILTTRTQWIDPSGGATGGGYYQSSDLSAVLVASSGQAEYTEDLNPAGSVVTNLVTVFPGSGPRRVRPIGARIFAFDSSANQTYGKVTEDGGATWTQVDAPGGLRITDIGRLDNGRWVCNSSQGSTLRYYYSDDAGLPTNWTQATGAPSQNGMLLCNGEVAIQFGTNDGVRRTTDGAAWTSAVRPLPGLNAGNVGACAGDVFVFGDTNSIVLHVTEDAGLTWIEVPFRNCRRIDVYDGMWVACCPGTEGGIFYSTDPANTWTAAVLPPGVGSGFYSSLYVAPISLEPTDA